jgi:uroporphyrinogen III methyltransferase/synthase
MPTRKQRRRALVVITSDRRRLPGVERLAASCGLVLRWLPVVRARPCPRAALQLRQRLAAGRFDWVAITSARVVPALSRAWRRYATLDRPTRPPRIAAVGPATAGRLRLHGLRAQVVGPGPGGEALARAIIRTSGPPVQRVLWPRSARHDPGLSAELRRHRARVVEVPVYRPVVARPAGVAALSAELADGRVAALCATAPLVTRALIGRMTSRARAALVRRGLVVASFGPSTTGELRRWGITPRLERGHGDLAAVVRALIRTVAADREGRTT